MPDWDEDGPQSRDNLKTLLHQIVQSSRERKPPQLESARQWHHAIMTGLSAPSPHWIGAFRGEAGLELIQVRIGSDLGSLAHLVAEELAAFQTRLQKLVQALDQLLPPGQLPDQDQVSAILDLCAWAHAEWIRIHPFANGSGRTARLWANSLAVRYGLPPFVSLRPRPTHGYSEAAAKAMQRDWKPTASVFLKLLNQFAQNL